MTFDEEVKLITYAITENDIGDPIKTANKRPILASRLDYRNKEFYQAMASGLKPSVTFAISQYEYEGEPELEHDGTKFRIIDVYPIKARDQSEFETLALICEGVVNK